MAADVRQPPGSFSIAFDRAQFHFVLVVTMFTLADKHSFVGDPEMCWLHAGYRYSEESFSWQLHLQSQNKRLHLADETNEASFGIALRPHLGARDWRELPRGSMEIPPELLGCSFMFHFGAYMQWEDLLSLDLRFGTACGGQLEVWADGRGAVEAAPDLFPEGEVEFHIHTWSVFADLQSVSLYMLPTP